MSPQSTNQLADKHLRLIGLIATEWSMLETTIDFGLWGLLGIHQPAGRAVTSYIHATTRFDLLITLAEKQFSGGIVDNLKSLRTKFKDLLAQRNDYVHAQWKYIGGSPYFGYGKINKRGNLEAKKLQTSISEFEQVVLDIQSLNNDLNNVMELNDFPFPDP